MIESRLEAIVVPTGPSRQDDENRAIAGAEQFNFLKGETLVDPYLIVTGKYNNGRYRGSQTEHIHSILSGSSISDDFIAHESRSSNTRENVLYTSELLLADSTQGINLSTDFWHGVRMQMLFKQAVRAGYAPQDLDIFRLRKNLPASYPLPKALAALAKDYILRKKLFS